MGTARVSAVVGYLGWGSFVVMCACGSRDQLRTHEPPTLLAPAPAATPAASSAAPAPPPPPSPPDSAPKTPRAKFVSFALAPTSGKVDKIGSKDGAFTPDGIRDLVFDAELEGASVIAFIIVANGAYTADTFVGTQLPPSDADAEIKPGLGTAGIGVYENDKLANAPDGSLTPLPAGKHVLKLYVSSREVPSKASFKAFAVLDDRSMVASPVVSTK
jgi:hypothetical protein